MLCFPESGQCPSQALVSSSLPWRGHLDSRLPGAMPAVVGSPFAIDNVIASN